MFDPLKDIREFHEKFGLAYDGPPREIPLQLARFRYLFLVEELCEYGMIGSEDAFEAQELFGDCFVSAQNKEQLEHKLDALVDLMYILLGTAYLHGFNRFGEAWQRVHEANMKKIRCPSSEESSLRGSAFDVIKPEGWVSPDLSDLV